MKTRKAGAKYLKLTDMKNRFYIIVTTNNRESLIPLMPARQALSIFNNYASDLDKCKRLEVTKVELYKINEELPKRIFLAL